MVGVVSGGGSAAIYVAALAACLALGAPRIAAAGPFDEVEQIDAKLVRGQSSREDVRRLLGEPDGRGEGRFPPIWTRQEIWFYEEVIVHASRLNPEIRDGKLEADVEGRQLFVLFSEGRYDGYLWYGLRVEGEDPP